jgi:predicted Abi (CAAX) family protease
MRQRTSSIWPGVGLHWLMVNLWQTWLGGFVLES